MTSVASESFDSSRSTCVDGEWSPLPVASSCFLADAAAPVFPINGDDLTEQTLGLELGLGFQQVDLCSSSSSTVSRRRFHPIPLDERHVFLCFKEPQAWPALVEAADFDRLPRFLAAAIKLKKKDMVKKTRLTICEGRDGTESSNGDVMIFPDMVRYKGLTHFDVDTFVEEVLVHNQEWLSGRPEKLLGFHMFVCAHANHDARCGVSGPIIISRLRHEMSVRGLGKKVFVRPCTHIGGHKYRGNVIMYNRDALGLANGVCFSCTTSDDVCSLLDDLFGTASFRDIQRGDPSDDTAEGVEIELNHDHQHTYSECRSNDAWQAIQDQNGNEYISDIGVGFNWTNSQSKERSRFAQRLSDNDRCTRSLCLNLRWWQTSWWFGSWEKEDTLAALAVVGAASSVALAYHLYSTHARN